MLLFFAMVIVFFILMVLMRVSTLNHKVDVLEECVTECITKDSLHEYIVAVISGNGEINDEST